MPITMAARSKARNVFARFSTGVMGSNSSRGMNVFVCSFYVFVLCCIDRGIATG
jgi:hypothetical protein